MKLRHSVIREACFDHLALTVFAFSTLFLAGTKLKFEY